MFPLLIHSKGHKSETLPQHVHELFLGHKAGINSHGQKALVHLPDNPRQIHAQINLQGTDTRPEGIVICYIVGPSSGP